MSDEKIPDSRLSPRNRAEELLRKTSGELRGLDPTEARELLHELDVCRAELEIRDEELRQAQMDLAHPWDRLGAIFQNAPIAYVVLDESGVIRQANEACLRMLNRQGENLNDTPFADLLVDVDASTFRALYREFFRNPAENSIELKVRREPGEEHRGRTHLSRRHPGPVEWVLFKSWIDGRRSPSPGYNS